MKFKLNDYNQGVTEKELLEDVIKVQNEIGDKYLSINIYKKYGKYSFSTFYYRFGSWINVLKKLGLRIERKSDEIQRISNEMLIKDLLDVSKKLKKNKITSSEYIDHGKYSIYTINDRFKSWENFIRNAGLEKTGHLKKVETIELFRELEHIWISLGKQPTTTDMKKGISKYSLDTFTRRFGGWRNTLHAFIDYINEDVEDPEDFEEEIIQNEENNEIKNRLNDKEIRNKIKRTPRNINLKLRFRVLVRDNFRCCYCGASPAKEPNVELHVDHILPWSEGGETVLENLQTSCSTCNLGKGNMTHKNVD